MLTTTQISRSTSGSPTSCTQRGMTVFVGAGPLGMRAIV